MIRVVIADDQALVRGGLRMIIESDPLLEVVAEAADGREAVERVREHLPDVVLMNVNMPNLDGIAATRLITEQQGSVRVLVLTTFGADEHVYEALRAGASGFLLKDVRPELLNRAVRDVANGEVMLAPTITRRLIEQFVRRPAPGSTLPASLKQLSDREIDVLRLVARGRSNQEIAGSLFLGEATVKSHISHIFAKLAVRDRVQAVVLTYESGLVQPGETQPGDRS